MDAIQKRVVESLKSHSEFLNDKNVLKGALMDIIPRDRLQVNVLIFAYELDVIKRLTSEEVAMVKASIVSGLQSNYGITKDNAVWGVETWCFILGVEQVNNSILVGKPDDSYERRVKKALQEVQKRRQWRQNQLTIYNDGQYISDPEKYEKVFLQCDINTIDLSRCKNLKHLFIWSGSHGDLFGIPVTQELSISIFYDWQYLKQFSFGEAEKLSLSIYSTDDVVALSLEKTKELNLSFKHKNDVALPVTLDLTGCDNLEKLSISDVVLKNLENIGELSSIKSIAVKNSDISSMDWMQNWPQLEAVSLVDCNISDVNGIESLRCLNTLNLNNNDISDLSPVFELLQLKRLYIQGNPVDDQQIEELRSNGVHVVVTDKDKNEEKAEGEEERFLESAIDIQLQEDDKPLDQFAPFLQKGILESRKLPFEERLKDMIQRRFQGGFYDITPWRVWSTENSCEVREQYIKRKQELYPFLKVPAHMLEALSIDKKKFCDSDVKNRLIFLGSENITCIEINEWAGREGIKVKRRDDYKCSKIENEVVKNWPQDELEYIQNRCIEVVITDKYALLDPEEVVYPIIISILAVRDGICDGKTAIIGQFKTDGNIKRETASLRNIGLSEKEGAKNVFIYGSARSYDKAELSKHNLNYYYVKDYHEVLAKLKEISSNKYEQLSLMNFM